MKKKPVNKIKKNTATPNRTGNGLVRGQITECLIDSLNHEGFGFGFAEGLPLLVKGALPGELVRVRISFVGQRETFAEVMQVLRKSPVRVAQTPCDKNKGCDGCPLIGMQYKSQLEWKQNLVQNCIHRYPALQSVPVNPVIPSEKRLGYRNSAKLVVTGKFTDPVIGMYRSNSHDVIDIGCCPLHHPLINRVIEAVKIGVKKGKVPIYSPRTSSGLLRYLVVRVSETDDRAMVVFVTARRSFNEIHHLGKYLQSAVPEVEVVVQNVNSSTGNVIIGQYDYFVTKQQALVGSIGEIKFSISPRSFFQVNSSGARSIYEKVREWGGLSGRETVIDVYCGVGGISLFIADRAQEVIGIETVEAAVADAGKNATMNGIRNCVFKAGDAAVLLGELREEQKHVDLIVLNPPRKGCEEKVLREAVRLNPSQIIYVSCSPQTLARDLDMLASHGYKTSEVQPVDMFPQTQHVENVVRLSRID
jgi:23S rRNA (uracil1939-C5)-methyltransferase